MLYIANKFKVNGSVLEIEEIKDTIVVVDNLYYVYVLNKTHLNFEKSINVTKNHEPFHRYAKSISISKDGYLSIPLTKTSKAAILKLENNLHKKNIISWHKADLSFSVFSKDCTLLATGGEDGKTNIFSLPTFNLITSIFPRPDYISCATFSNDSKLIAIASFNKQINIFDIERNIDFAEFDTPDVVEDMLFFDENKKLFYVCKDGLTGTYNLETKSIISQNKIIDAWFTTAMLLNDNFALVGTKDKFISIIRLSDNKSIYTLTMPRMGITKIKKIDGKMYVGYIDGTVDIIDEMKYFDELEVYLKVNDYKKAKEVTEKNILLRTHPEYIKKMDEGWKDALQKAIDFIAKNKIDSAIEVVSPFIDDPAKNEEFSFYMSQKDYVNRFLDAVESKNLQEAYAIAEQYKDIKKLAIYENLENYWQKVFETSKKLLAANPQLNLTKAQELLKPFANVKQKKDLVYTLLRNTDKYLLADKALKDKDFVEYFRLTEKFPFLKDTEIYKKSLLIGEQLLDKISILEVQRDFQKALEFAKVLSSMSPFKLAATEKTKGIEKKINFLDAYKKKDIQKAFYLIESSPELKALPEFVELNEAFNKIAQKAYDFAFAGDAANALKILNDYLPIKYWSEKIGAIMKTAYLNEIKNFAASEEANKADWSKTLIDFIERFGKNDEIEKICEITGLKKYLDAINSKGNIMGYKKLNYLATIIAKR